MVTGANAGRNSPPDRLTALGTAALARHRPRIQYVSVPTGRALYADDFAVLGKAPAAEMLAAVEALMTHLRLPINAEKTRCCRLPETSMTFLGYWIGRNHRRDTGRAYIGTRPSPASVQSICRLMSELTTRRDGLLPPGDAVASLNRLLTGWANYFILGQVGPAYAAIDRHATRRLRQWVCRNHKARSGPYVRLSDERLWQGTSSRALDGVRRASRGRRHDLVREPDAGNPHLRFGVRRRNRTARTAAATGGARSAKYVRH